MKEDLSYIAFCGRMLAVKGRAIFSGTTLSRLRIPRWRSLIKISRRKEVRQKEERGGGGKNLRM
jgi:hypothetical protein